MPRRPSQPPRGATILLLLALWALVVVASVWWAVDRLAEASSTWTPPRPKS